MNSLHKFSLCASVSLIGATMAPAAVLYDLNSTVLDGGVGENTFVANTAVGGALSYNSGVPSLTETFATSGVASFSLVTFASTTLTNLGDSLTVSYSFTPSSATVFANNDNTMRVGFFNSGGTQISGNLTGLTDPAFVGDTGYQALYRATAGTVASTNTFYQRNATGGATNSLWDSGTRTQLAGPTLDRAGTGVVTGSFTLTLVATGVQMTSVINGGTAQSFIDTTSPFTTFNAFSFFGLSGSANPTLTFSSLTITSTPVPEPSGILLTGVAGTGLAFARRRRA